MKFVFISTSAPIAVVMTNQEDRSELDRLNDVTHTGKSINQFAQTLQINKITT